MPTVVIGAPSCGSTNLDRARAIRENDRTRSSLVEDREGTKILKAILTPVAMLFGGGVDAEPDPARVSLTMNDSHSERWTPADEEIFRRQVEAEWNAILERARGVTTSEAKSVDR